MIVKIQKPLLTNGDEPMALIYNTDRTVSVQTPFSQVENMFEEREAKIYCKAILDDEGILHIGKRVQVSPF